MTRPTRTLISVGIAVLLATTACSSGDETIAQDSTVDLGEPGDCVVVDMSVSSEKVDLLNALARTFNESGTQTEAGECIFVRPQNKASGAATTLLADEWDEQAHGPRPVIWSPASSSWGAILNQRLADDGQEAMAPTDARPFMLTPLVIAMPEPMADALGYPEKPLGFADIARLARDPQGWATYGHPEWGPFRLGKTNPNFSTSGLSALIGQTYAGVGKTSGLSQEDLANPAVVDLSKAIESSVVHYGDITMTFLNNWFRADKRGTALTYASAVAIEEKSLIDYNSGNPDGVLDPGEEPKEPRIPLVAVYPSEGTLYSDNPFFILDAEWVSSAEREAAEAFQEFVQTRDNQRRVLEYGFRPGNPDVEVSEPIVAANGVDPNQPATLLEVPQPRVMVDLLDAWAANRKGARVLMVLDVSGSMAEPASPASDETKLDLAKSAAITALDEFNATDEVGLRIFSTKLGPAQDQNYIDLVPVGPIGSNIEELRRRIDELIPTSGTPLLEVTQESYRTMLDGYDPARINAVLLLTDGRNEDGNPEDDDDQETALIAELRKSATGEESRPVRIFTIAYGSDADTSTLKAIAEASNAAAYSAVDAASINTVFTQVVSNFDMPASLRDRFFTQKVARSITDAPAIVATGAGAAIAVLIGLGPIGAVIGGAAFLAGRVGLAIPRGEPGAKAIDPFVLGEPWRRLVQDAVAAQRQFTETVRRAREGPLRDELASIGSRIEESVLECWQVARSGDALSTARRRIDVPGAQRELAEVQSAGYSSDTIAGTVAALEAQLATAAWMDATIAGTRDQLRLLNARLDEAVSRSIELSATSAGVDQLHSVGEDVSGIVGEMEALRQALEVVSTPGTATG